MNPSNCERFMTWAQTFSNTCHVLIFRGRTGRCTNVLIFRAYATMHRRGFSQLIWVAQTRESAVRRGNKLLLEVFDALIHSYFGVMSWPCPGLKRCGQFWKQIRKYCGELSVTQFSVSSMSEPEATTAAVRGPRYGGATVWAGHSRTHASRPRRESWAPRTTCQWPASEAGVPEHPLLSRVTAGKQPAPSLLLSTNC